MSIFKMIHLRRENARKRKSYPYPLPCLDALLDSLTVNTSHGVKCQCGD